MCRRLLLRTSILIVLHWISGLLWISLAFEGGGIVYPGRGVIISSGKDVDDIRMSERLSPTIEKKYLKRKDVAITVGPDRRVERIRLSSSSFSVAVSLLRIKDSRIADVLRFYGRGDTDLKPDKLIVQYPDRGIDFEIDKVNERIEAITVYNPTPPKFSIEQYMKQKEQLQPKR